MVKTTFTDEWRHAERRMILSYVAADRRAAVAALLGLDDVLRLVVAVREPMIAQLRLTWWHGALDRLDAAPPPAEPLLTALTREVLPLGVSGARLAGLVEGWEEVIDGPPFDTATMMRFADARGAVLFHLIGTIVGASPVDPLDDGGRGWAMADLAQGNADASAAALASPMLAAAAARRWSRPARALGAMAHLARMPGAGAAARTMRALWHRFTGL